MIRNFFKIAIRNLYKDSFYSSINIFGLSIGITTCLLIFLYINHELSYDKFHKDFDRIYRVTAKAKLAGSEMEMGSSSPPLADRLIHDIEEIESITRLQLLNRVIKFEDNIYREDDMLYADSTFFNVFSFEVLQGDPNTMLVDPYSIVLTEETAIRYFGETEIEYGNVLGQQLIINDEIYQVTGLLENVPENSHFSFDFLVSMSSTPEAISPIWLNMSMYTYLKLRDGADPKSLDDKFSDIVMTHLVPQIIQFMKMPPELLKDKESVRSFFQYGLQPISSIHLNSELRAEIGINSDISYVYIFSAIALFIIVIACINFMNLATARGSKRALEVGVRKSLGSSKKLLVWQFLIESILFSFIAMIIALGLTEALKYPFSMITGKILTFNIFEQPWMLSLTFGFALLVGLLAGSYPAFYLTRFKPVEVLKNLGRTGNSRSLFRNSLVVVQFAISIGLIVCTILVSKQMNYVSNMNLGFDKENVIVIENARSLGNNFHSFKNELGNNSRVVNVSSSKRIPSVKYNSPVCTPEGEDGVDIPVFTNEIDYDYINTFKMELVEGRNFSKEFPSDSTAIIINESAVKRFGWIEDDNKPIGKYVQMINPNLGTRLKLYVVGVVKDFNFESLKSDISANVMVLNSKGNFISIRVKPGNMSELLKEFESMWKNMANNAPFQYSFLDQRFDDLYQSEQKMSKIFTVFTSIAIFIACLGLLGLAAYTTEQRTKEIGIRKAMGASVPNVVTMLNLEFIKLVGIAIVIGSPVAWYLMQLWLGDFVYKTEIGIWPFLLAAFLAAFIAILTVGFQSLKAALANPVNSLRSE